MTSNKKFFAFSQPINNFFKFGGELHIVWKDIHSTFLGCGDLLETETGLTSSNIVGLDDRDLIWADRADQYRKDEEEMLASRTTRCIHEPAKTVNGEVSLLTFKTPMTGSSGLIEGIFQISFILEQNPMLKVTKWINQLGILTPNPMLIPLSNQTIMQQLSKREQECFFHLSHGKSAKEIAQLLGCSPRTIESHIDNMKSKLDCRTRSELISKIV
ncbi:MAG: regulatory protein, LuxR family [uncultured bacterium]|nr:MAG: regulatory protein, LuxR family [uncultured bacterium]